MINKNNRSLGLVLYQDLTLVDQLLHGLLDLLSLELVQLQVLDYLDLVVAQAANWKAYAKILGDQTVV